MEIQTNLLISRLAWCREHFADFDSPEPVAKCIPQQIFSNIHIHQQQNRHSNKWKDTRRLLTRSVPFASLAMGRSICTNNQRYRTMCRKHYSTNSNRSTLWSSNSPHGLRRSCYKCKRDTPTSVAASLMIYKMKLLDMQKKDINNTQVNVSQ